MKKKEYLITENAGSICIHDLEMDSVCDFWKDVEDRSEPFRLSGIALDAFNTANKCGLLPSELLEQNQNLLDALKYAKTRIEDYNHARGFDYTMEDDWIKITDTINQIEQ